MIRLLVTAFIVQWGVLFLHANEPENRPKTDVMLFGDVKSGDEHIPFASVSVKGTTVGSAADATGHFKLVNLPVGRQTVIISAVGYKPYHQEVNFEVNTSYTIHAVLEPDNIGIEQVVVSADRNNKSRQESSTIVNAIGAKLLQRTQSITLSEGLNYSPGLRMENNCQNCGFTQIRMNGLKGPYTQILINSRPVFSGLAGVYGLELIPANMIDRVEVIRGGGSSMYGSNAIAGTVNLITKDPVSNTFSIQNSNSITGPSMNNHSPDFNLNMNGSYVSDSYKTGFTLFGFYRNRQPFDANNDGFTELSTIRNSTLGARFFQRIADRGKLTLDYFYIDEFRRGGNKLELPMHEADITESVDHGIHSAAANFDLLMRESDKVSVFLSAEEVNRHSYYGANQDLSAYGFTEDLTYSTGIQYIRQLGYFFIAPASLTSGLEINGSKLQDEKLGYYDPEEDVHHPNTEVANQQLSTKAAFLQTDWNGKKWVLSAGVRYDNYLVSDKAGETNDVKGKVFSPRISLLINPIPHWQVRAGFARGFRAPQIFDEDLHIETSGSRQVLHQNDPDLEQETSNSYTASLNFTNDEGKWQYQILAEGFLTQLMNPFANVYGSPDENGVVIYTRTNAEAGATVKGINFEINIAPSTRWQLQSGYTVQKSMFSEPQEFNERRFFRAPDNYGYFSLNYSPSLKINLSATGNYTGRMLIPYFGPQLKAPSIGELRTSQSFFDAGFKAAYTIKISDNLIIEWSAGIKNLFNSYQKDFDTGMDRDPAYMYGPLTPRTYYMGVRLGNLL